MRSILSGAVVNRVLSTLSATLALAALAAPAQAQGGPAGPPSVGVVKVEETPITESNQFIGRVQAIQRVAIVARVTAYLEKVDFEDGAEVKKGDLLYELERPPFQADLDAKKAVADQFAAQLVNAKLTAGRAESLLRTNAGAQATVDSSVAAQKALEAQVLGANASVATSQINLDYTRIAAPIDGKLGRTSITPGNVVSPSSGTLVTIVSQDPMYVAFPVAVRTLQELGKKYIPQGGSKAVEMKIKLPDGTIYSQIGKLDFVDNTVNTGTDTVVVRGTIPNPKLAMATEKSPIRELYDNEFVTVYLEGVKPVNVLGIPRSAVLMDQQGDYVWVVGADDKVERRTVTLGQSTPTVASVTGGLKAGEIIVSEGVQKVRGGQQVSPSPAEPAPSLEKGK